MSNHLQNPSSTKILYRILLHMIRRHKIQEPWISICLPLTSQFCGVQSNSELPPFDLKTVKGACSLLQWSFHRGIQQSKTMEDENIAMNRAFDTLSTFNTLFLLKQRRELNKDRAMIKYSLGSVIRHKTYGYRGVIFGWDRTCQQSEDWMKQMRVHELRYGSNQPFYYIQPENFSLSESDSESIFKYVAEENIIELKDSRLHISTVCRYFYRYNVKLGRYTPVSFLRYMFPDEYLIKDPLEEAEANSNPMGDDLTKANCSDADKKNDILKTNNV